MTKQIANLIKKANKSQKQELIRLILKNINTLTPQQIEKLSNLHNKH